jgi:hypothetical protein
VIAGNEGVSLVRFGVVFHSFASRCRRCVVLKASYVFVRRFCHRLKMFSERFVPFSQKSFGFGVVG